MFRCPCCARVSKLPLTEGHVLLISKDMDYLWLSRQPVTLAGLNERVENSLPKVANFLAKKGLSLDLKGDNFLECPSCNVSSKFSAWNRAWDFPGDFFDADQICHCGGELWYDRVPGFSRYALICEECGWIKKNKVISGHSGDHQPVAPIIIR